MPPLLGCLMLDTRFPRLPGDVGNPESFPCPVTYRRLAGIGPWDALSAGPDRADVLVRLIEAGKELVASGATMITTSCGFLVLFQAELAASLPVPVFTSALVAGPGILAALPPGRRLGVVTAAAGSLTGRHLAAAGLPAETPVAGMPADGAFARDILGDRPQLDRDAVEREAVAAARSLVAQAPDIGAVLLECTNLPPYRAAIAAATGYPVFDIQTELVARLGAR